MNDLKLPVCPPVAPGDSARPASLRAPDPAEEQGLPDLHNIDFLIVFIQFKIRIPLVTFCVSLDWRKSQLSIEGSLWDASINPDCVWRDIVTICSSKTGIKVHIIMSTQLRCIFKT